MDNQTDNIRLAIPKGRMCDGAVRLLGDAGIDVRLDTRDYRPDVSLEGLEAKLLKPQQIVGMLVSGSRDVGFTGLDWVTELGAADELVELLDTRMDKVRLVAAMPSALVEEGGIPRSRPLVVASEYQSITLDWIRRNDLDAKFLPSWGATEVLPPEDADCIVDNTATGSTLRANNLQIVDELLTSSTRLFTTRAALDDPSRRDRIESLVLLLRSVLDARERVMLEVNVDATRLSAIVAVVPCMRVPTVAALANDSGFAVKAAVKRTALPELIPKLRAMGGTDVVVTRLDQIVP